MPNGIDFVVDRSRVKRSHQLAGVYIAGFKAIAYNDPQLLFNHLPTWAIPDLQSHKQAL